MSPSSIHDPPASHIDGAHHRREAAPKPRAMRPLLTNTPLPHDREKKPAAQSPKKRKRVIPTTPALTFDPKHNNVPSGKQDLPISSPIPRPPASDSSTSSFDEQQTTPFTDRDQFYNGYDAQKRPRIFSECSSVEYSTSSYPNTPCTDVNDMSSASHDFYDSPVSYTSSSSPDLSDQFPCAAEFAVQVQPMYPYGNQGYVQQPVAHQDPYGYSMGPCPDRPAPGYPVQYSASHGIPAYPENGGYPYPPRRYQ